MKHLHFQGYSDDTFMCSGHGIDVDKDTCASGKPVFMRVDSEEGSLIVSGQYAPGPCAGWVIGVAPANFEDEEKDIPKWPVSIVQSDRPYSPQLIIVAPDDVKVSLAEDDED